MKIIAENRKAKFDYQILETFHAGLVLTGQEVKSLKTKGISLSGTYVSLKSSPNPEFFWIGAVITPYQQKNAGFKYDPKRSRKLLLTKKEINYLIGKLKQKGLTLAPLKVYTNNTFIKLEFALVKGKKKFDKREQIKKRDIERKISHQLKLRG